jgi:hypothetical protein
VKKIIEREGMEKGSGEEGGVMMSEDPEPSHHYESCLGRPRPIIIII